MGVLMHIVDCFYLPEHAGYIAGTDDGIVTVGGVPASRKIYVFDAVTLKLIQTTTSLANGHYLIRNLNPNRKYLLICRDYKGDYEPYAWDFVTPKADKTPALLDELWQTMLDK